MKQCEGAQMIFDVYVIPSDKLLVARPKGVFDAATAEKIIEFIELKEAEEETGFNRFCDLSCLEGIYLSPLGVATGSPAPGVQAKRYPRQNCLFRNSSLAYGIARMYERMLDSPGIDVRVWSNKQAAADWLGVNQDKLTY
jgi:hypothetical protein